MSYKMKPGRRARSIVKTKEVTYEDVYKQVMKTWEQANQLDAGWFTIEGLRFLITPPYHGCDLAKWVTEFKRHTDDASIKSKRFTKMVELVHALGKK